MSKQKLIYNDVVDDYVYHTQLGETKQLEGGFTIECWYPDDPEFNEQLAPDQYTIGYIHAIIDQLML